MNVRQTSVCRSTASRSDSTGTHVIDNHKEGLIKLAEHARFLPLPLGGAREGAKLDAHKPSPQPPPKGRGRKKQTSIPFCLLVCPLIMMSIQDPIDVPRAQSHMSQSQIAIEETIARPLTTLSEDEQMFR